MKKRETTVAFLAGVAVTGAFFAGMGMGSANGSAAVQQVQIVGIKGKPGYGWDSVTAEVKMPGGLSGSGIPVRVQNTRDFPR